MIEIDVPLATCCGGREGGRESETCFLAIAMFSHGPLSDSMKSRRGNCLPIDNLVVRSLRYLHLAEGGGVTLGTIFTCSEAYKSMDCNYVARGGRRCGELEVRAW